MSEDHHELAVSRSDVQHHVEQIVRTWVGLPVDAGIKVPALPRPLVRLLLRTEECESPRRDQPGHWEFSYSDNFHRGSLWVPEVDEWIGEQRRELAGQVELEPLWPHGHSFAVCLTHDVDMVSRQVSPRQAARGIRTAGRRLSGRADSTSERAWRATQAFARSFYYGISRTPSAEGTIGRCMEIEKDRGVTSSYFFTVAPLHPYDCLYEFTDSCGFRNERKEVAEIIQLVADEGFDVGLHGSYLSAHVEGLLRNERNALEDVVGQPVRTGRQHYLNFDTLITPRLQDSAGLEADSTLGFNRNVGFRAGTSLPFRMFDYRIRSPFRVLEVPLVIQEAALLEPNALELDVDLAKRIMSQIFATTEAVGGVTTILFHPHKLLDPRYRELYEFAIEYGLDHDAWVTSLAQVSDWWHRREARLNRTREEEPMPNADPFRNAAPS